MGAYFVVPAPGHYGDVTRVLGSYATLADARRSIGRSSSAVVRKGQMEKGDRWLRVYEQVYPLVPKLTTPASTPAG
jgi:hypothetical protein